MEIEETKENKFLKLNKNCLNCENCELYKSRKNVVFGKGNLNSKILIIGEAPGAKEDEKGIPFVGRAGTELDKELVKIGLSLNEIYITNILKCRPPKNRNPKLIEIKTCSNYLTNQIEIINPSIIITLGNFASKFILSKFNTEKINKIEGIKKIHGTKTEIKIKNKKYIVIPIYHPSAMMYKPSLREEFEKDFKTMNNILKNI